MLSLKAVLLRVQPIPGFVYEKATLETVDGIDRVDVGVRCHEQRQGKCAVCLQGCPGYDRVAARSWRQVPLWGMACFLHYAPRRVTCAEHGVLVEHLPWSEGKRPITLGMIAFLSMWARRLSWAETARAFDVSWEMVFRSLEWTVGWGLKNRQLSGVTAIGVDEIHRGKGGFLTLIYQIDEGMKRLLWVVRTAA